MQHHPESIHDAINTSELGALIAEHRNAFLCDLLRPMLDTFDREGIQMSAVLRALSTISRERSASLAEANGSNPWNQCDSWLQKAHQAALEAEKVRTKCSKAKAGGHGGISPSQERYDERPPQPPQPVSMDEDAWAQELLREA